jgi:hypothetical protein
MKTDTDSKIKSLLERNTPRTLDEQVQHAYLHLLAKLEMVMSKAVSDIERCGNEGNTQAVEALQPIVDDLTFAWSKNVALKFKLANQ